MAFFRKTWKDRWHVNQDPDKCPNPTRNFWEEVLRDDRTHPGPREYVVLVGLKDGCVETCFAKWTGLRWLLFMELNAAGILGDCVGPAYAPSPTGMECELGRVRVLAWSEIGRGKGGALPWEGWSGLQKAIHDLFCHIEGGRWK